jgi:hypothetical protein
MDDPWSDSRADATVVEAIRADAATRADAMPAESAAWWWLTHGDDGDEEAREHRLMRLRMGIDLLIVREPLHGNTSSRRPPGTSSPVPSLGELAAYAGPANQSVALTYVEIVLVDEAGAPVADEAYELELPDGRVCTGQLDADGLARVDSVPVGACVVRFPNCHRAEVGAA